MAEDSDLKQCSYFQVRYVPDAVKQEFINIGVFLYCESEQFLDCLFSDDFRRVTRFHPHADTQFLRELQVHFEQQIAEHDRDLDGYIAGMQHSFSNLIELSPPGKCLTADLSAELHDLFERHVGVRLSGPAKQDTRMRIKHRMTDCLRRCGVLDPSLVEKGIPASHWTAAGDPFIFDFGYMPPARAGKPNGQMKLIHTLSLQRDPKLAKELMWTFARVLEKEPSRLTIGHEDNPDPNDPSVHFSQNILQHERTQLLPVSKFDAYAQSVRAELVM